jgi:hypothetical protein
MLAGLSPGLSDGAAVHCSDTILNEFCQAGELTDSCFRREFIFWLTVVGTARRPKQSV